MVLNGVLDQALLLLSVRAVVSAQWWKNRVPPSSEQKQRWTGVPAACAARHRLADWVSCLWNPDGNCQPCWWAIGLVGPVVWLSSPNQSPSSLGAGLSRCSVWGHGCPGCYGNGARLDGEEDSPSPLITHKVNPSLLRTPDRAKPVEYIWGPQPGGLGAGAQCSPPAFKGHAGENYSQWFFWYCFIGKYYLQAYVPWMNLILQNF